MRWMERPGEWVETDELRSRFCTSLAAKCDPIRAAGVRSGQPTPKHASSAAKNEERRHSSKYPPEFPVEPEIWIFLSRFPEPLPLRAISNGCNLLLSAWMGLKIEPWPCNLPGLPA